MDRGQPHRDVDELHAHCVSASGMDRHREIHRRIPEMPHANLHRAGREVAQCKHALLGAESLPAQRGRRRDAVRQRDSALFRDDDADDRPGRIGLRRGLRNDAPGKRGRGNDRDRQGRERDPEQPAIRIDLANAAHGYERYHSGCCFAGFGS